MDKINPRDLYATESITRYGMKFIESTTGIIGNSVKELAKIAMQTKRNATDIDSQNTADKVSRFYDEYNLPNKAELLRATKLLQNPNSVLLRGGHQPNIFGYMPLFNQFILLELVRREVNSQLSNDAAVVLFVFHDLDAHRNNRFRNSLMLMGKEGGKATIGFGKLKSMRDTPLALGNELNKQAVYDWRSQISNTYAELLGQLAEGDCYSEMRRLKLNIEAVNDLIVDTYREGDTFSDYAIRFIVNIVNKCWQYPILFVKASELSKNFNHQYEELLTIREKISVAENSSMDELSKFGVVVERSPSNSSTTLRNFWVVCASCQKRFETNALYSDELYTCPFCHKQVGSTTPTYREMGYERFLLIPKAIPYVLVLNEYLRPSLNIGHIGAASYILIARSTANKLGWYFGPTKLWTSKWIPCTYSVAQYFAQHHNEHCSIKILSEMRFSIIDMVIAFSIKEVKSLVEAALGNGDLAGPHILGEAFAGCQQYLINDLMNQMMK